jgi:hypothetical protein
MRFGSTGSHDLYAGGARPTFFQDHPEVTRWKYLEIPPTGRARYRCANETMPGAHPWPEGTRERGQQFICQCAALPPKSDELCDARPTPMPTWTPEPTPAPSASQARTGAAARAGGIGAPATPAKDAGSNATAQALGGALDLVRRRGRRVQLPGRRALRAQRRD